jgi:hypothetical protein
MFRPGPCLWFCLLSLCRWTVSFSYVSVIDKNNRLMLLEATPGFLRAGVSNAYFAHYRLHCNYYATWTGLSSCLGFLHRRDSWHPPQHCILLLINIKAPTFLLKKK